MSLISAATKVAKGSKMALTAGEKFTVTNKFGTTFQKTAKGAKTVAAAAAPAAAPVAASASEQAGAVAKIAKAKGAKPNGNRIASTAREIDGLGPHSTHRTYYGRDQRSTLEKVNAKIDGMTAPELKALHGKVLPNDRTPRSKAAMLDALKGHVQGKTVRKETPQTGSGYSSYSGPTLGRTVADTVGGIGIGLMALSLFGN